MYEMIELIFKAFEHCLANQENGRTKIEEIRKIKIGVDDPKRYNGSSSATFTNGIVINKC
jgi:hypothetical protein